MNRKQSNGESGGHDDAARIVRLFLGTVEELERATVMLLSHKGLRTRTWLSVQSEFPSLNSWQLTDVWTDTVLAVRKKAMRRTFTKDKPFKAFLRTIALRRATDLVRHLYGSRPRKKKRLSRDDATGPPEGPVSGGPGPAIRPQVHFESPSVADCEDQGPAQNAKLQELLEAVRVFAKRLPSKQRIVLEAFAAVWPNTSLDTLTAKVREVQPKATGSSVKRAREEAFRKLQQWLAEQSPAWEEYFRRFLREQEQRKNERRNVIPGPDRPEKSSVHDSAHESVMDRSPHGTSEEKNGESRPTQ